MLCVDITSHRSYRRYRYGQQKPTFIYRLIGDGTIEDKMYTRSCQKIALASRVVERRTAKQKFKRDEEVRVFYSHTNAAP